MAQEHWEMPEWDDKDVDWDKEFDNAAERAKGGWIDPDFRQQDLPITEDDGDGATLIRILTLKSGERFQHFWRDAVTDKIQSANCSAPPNYTGDKADICLACAAGKSMGGADQGGVDANHTYYLLVLKGKLKNFLVQDSKTKEEAMQFREVWELEPKIFECGNSLMKGIKEYRGNKEEPPGAEGDITKYPFKITKKKTGPGTRDISYKIAPLGEVAGFPEGVDLKSLKEMAKDKYEVIRSICKVTPVEEMARRFNVELPETPNENNGGDNVENVSSDKKEANDGGLSLEDNEVDASTTTPTKETKSDDLDDLSF